MSNLNIIPIFQQIKCTLANQVFNTMYFGRHCEKNLLILQYDFTVMLIFGDDMKWSSPEWIKTVYFKQDPVKGIRIVGNDDDILMMDEQGNLWRLINISEFSAEENEEFSLSLKNNCSYEWVLFKKFSFIKVLALTRFGRGFACVGFQQDLKKKLIVLPSVNSSFADCTFEVVNETDSVSYYLLSLNINVEHSVFKNKLSFGEEVLLVSDRLSGRTYLCSEDGRSCLINQSNIFLISALHFPQEKCFVLCFENGKLFFYFYTEFRSHWIMHLMEKITFIEGCCCSGSCLLWSDGIDLHHTKIVFEQRRVKPFHLKLKCTVGSPLSFVRINHSGVIVTANNIYYSISAGDRLAAELKKSAKELLSRIGQCSETVATLEQKTDLLSHYLYCKDFMQRNVVKEKMKMKCEGNRLVIKNCSGLSLKEGLWKVRLRTTEMGKNLVHTVGLKCDLNEGVFLSVENPFRDKEKVNVSLVGCFEGKNLLFDLGEIEESRSDFEKDNVNKNLRNILKKRKLSCIK